MNNFSHSDLKKAAKELKIPKYSTAKSKEDLVKLLRQHAKLQGKKIVSKAEGGRCWAGYKPVKHKRAYSKGSCEKISTGGAIYNPTGDPEVSKKNEQIRKNMQKAREEKDKNQGPAVGGAVRDLALKHRDNLVKRLERIRPILGGQLPSSITDKLRDLDVKLGIKGGNVGMIYEDLYSNPKMEDKLIENKIKENQSNSCKGIAKECQPLAREIQKSKNNKIEADGVKFDMNTVRKCSEFYKEKQGCEKKKPKKGVLSKTADVLMKGTDKALGAIVTAGKPVFYATCGAAGAAAGGPVAGAAGALACKKLYDKMVEEPGYEKTLMDRADLSPMEEKMATLAGAMAGKKGAKAAGEGIKEEIDWDSIDWGSFEEQLKAYNGKMKKKLDMPEFADMILKTPEKFQRKTVKRARFYKNVLSKKK